jgi:uncharacterized short protein YbdD (DUF466 family)
MVRPTTLKQHCTAVWSVVRELTGDDAYERYLAHHVAKHPEQAPLSRSVFFKTEQRRKWEGVRRCC